ncbi:MAG: hypothetical protein ACSLFQ_10750 [Thermoanaerobaculia bacterium]
MTLNWFASSIVEERRLCRGGRLVTELSRFDRGWARTRSRGNSVEIDASDTPPGRGAPAAIVELLSAPEPVPPSLDIDLEAHAGWRFHVIARRRVAAHRGSDPDASLEELVVTTAPAHDHAHVSIVSTPASLRGDLGRLRDALWRPPARDPRIDALPIAWSGGSAAVLLHEALGHPAERVAPRVKWPAWLEVLDNPAIDGPGHLAADDCGRPVSCRDLTRGEQPSALRRWSFRDTPITRMSILRVAASGKPMKLPSPRVEIQLVEHGSWDPLTDEVVIRVSLAELVDDRGRFLLPRFTIRDTRSGLAARIEGWFGDDTRYPGVICSDEGQALPVGSFAVGLVARPR